MTQTETTYLSGVETAKLVRKALKREFPGTKFSVRSDHNSINVRWVDGPTTAQVNPVAKAYEGGGFDGMIDLAYTCESWLEPDGTAAPAYCGGTTGSRGVQDGYAYAPPSPDAKLVHFGALYIFTDRSDSREALEAAIDATCAYWGIEDRPVIVESKYGGVYLGNDTHVSNANDYSTRLVYRLAQETPR
jgi:hypothetical protein